MSAIKLQTGHRERLVSCTMLLMVLATAAMRLEAQVTIAPLYGQPGTRFNQDQVVQKREGGAGYNAALARSKPMNSVTLPGDVVFPHFIDGANWQTSVTMVNMDSKAVAFDVLFFNDNGTDLYVPVVGQSGLIRGMSIALGVRQSATFSTVGINQALSEGWALLSLHNSNDAVSGMSIFRSRVPGRLDFEATVPIVNQFQGHFIMPFDCTNGYLTGIAIANPTLFSVVIPITLYDENGNVVASDAMSLGAYSHMAFLTKDRWPQTTGRRGTIEFRASGFGVGALGLRFNPGGAFTSFNVMESYAWSVQ